ncbi:MAG: hypothetical protein ACF8PN_09505 [Phycisphaerales bacterium]
MLLKICKVLPFVNTFAHYNRHRHKDALKKFLFLWSISVIPIVSASIVVAMAPNGGFPAAVWEAIRTGFFATDQFIYAVAFLPPVLYLLFEKYELRGHFIALNKRKKNENLEIPGYFLIYLLTVLVLIFTAFVYGVTKANPYSVSATFLAVSGGVVYAFAMFCWYLSLLESVSPDPFGFLDENRAREAEMSEDFGKRIRSRERQQ